MKQLKNMNVFVSRIRPGGAAGVVSLSTTVLMAAAVLAGCSKDNNSTEGDGSEAVQFSAQIQAVTRTTGGGNLWMDGDRVGMFMLTSGGRMPGDILTLGGLTAYNREYNVDPATGALTPGDGLPICYPQTGTVDFVAYYPHTGNTGTDPGELTPDCIYNLTVAGQTDELTQNTLDVLYARSDNGGSGYAMSKATVGIEFGHVLSKVTFDITLGEGLTTLDGGYITATSFGGMPLTASLDLQDGTLTEGPAADFGALKSGTVPAGAAASFTALLIPQPAGGSGRTAVFTVDGKEFIWTIPEGETFDAATRYVYPVTVRMSGVEVGVRDISPWTTKDNGGGTAEQVQPVIQPESNSYMLEPGGPAILIPVSRANKAADPVYNLGAETTIGGEKVLGGVTADNYNVEMVWADLPVGPEGVVKEMFALKSGGEGYIYVEPGVAGNAVICIKDKANGAVKWSWHIWVTEPVTYATDHITDLTWMDRNLGAAVAGYYDPDGRNDFSTNGAARMLSPAFDGTGNNQTYYTSSARTGTTDLPPAGQYTDLPAMVQNPLGFASNSSFNGSVNMQGSSNNSWGGSSRTKTIYDPCPPGWKVPPRSVTGAMSWGDVNYAGWDNSVDNGRIFNGVNGSAGLGHFYPAAGFRYSNNLYNTGGGNYWTGSAEYTTNGYYLGFSQSGMVQGYFNRMNAMCVRCIQE